MLPNPFAEDTQYQNDLRDFKMPYRLYGRTDLEITKRKYQELSNFSYGLIVRLNRKW